MRLQDKLFPLMLQRNLPDTFSFKASNFKVQKSKESTARIVCWRELGLVNSFTLEVCACFACQVMPLVLSGRNRCAPPLSVSGPAQASFAGPSMGKNAGKHGGACSTCAVAATGPPRLSTRRKDCTRSGSAGDATGFSEQLRLLFVFLQGCISIRPTWKKWE